MEDIFSVAYQQTDDEKDLEYAFFGIFDGHGGREAAQFAKVKKYLKNSSEFVIGNINLQDNLMELITKNTKFWSDDDDTVLKAIREGFLEQILENRGFTGTQRTRFNATLHKYLSIFYTFCKLHNFLSFLF